MCRLFGMSGGREPIRATFWLLEAPDSLAEQSRRDPDGTGLGYFEPDGTPVVRKSPIAAYEDRAFAEAARQVESRTFVAHVRFASTGDLAERNTHPFVQDGRLFAHNGVVEGLDRLEAELGEEMALVHGETDSERVFALITREIAGAGGDVGAGLTAAARWVAEHLPVYALNVVLATPDGLWALRYPGTHRLFVLEREAGGRHGGRHLDAASPSGRMRVRCQDLATRPAVIVASEPMDEHPGWRLLESGELLAVDADLRVSSSVVLPEPPRYPLTLADLHEQAAASQAAA